MVKTVKWLFLLLLLLGVGRSMAQPKGRLTVTAYYSGKPEMVDSFAAEQLTHIIFSFCHLNGNQLHVDNAQDSTTIRKLTGLKKRNPSLKVLLSLGGWGGCQPCSGVFSSEKGRKEFARSVKALSEYFGTDGIDLDWEYPAIEGYPGHRYHPDDKKNFTHLLKELRKTLGNRYEISFAAGGFQKFLDEAVYWKEVMPLVDRVNLMTYDLVNGYSKTTGHHTALYSRTGQPESTDNCVRELVKRGVDPRKLVIGAAFYGRVWEKVPSVNEGLYQGGTFKTSVSFKELAADYTEQKGFLHYWDNLAKAPYIYHPEQQLFITYDDNRSIELKTKYAIEHGLNGIMFWELTHDPYRGGLLETIDRVVKSGGRQ